jgi:hypothetical protein
MIPVITYAPDLDPTTPGVIVDCDQAIPTKKGMRSAPGLAPTALPALAGPCKGSALLVRLDGQLRLFGATATEIYEAVSNAWQDRSGAAYTAAPTFWRFAQFGNISLAASKTNVLQQSASGAFASVSGAPKASIVITVGDFVMAFDTDDGGVLGDRPDSWWCAAIGTYDNWTPSIATQAATNRLTSIPGAITAARKFGDAVFVGKERGCYLGIYQGPNFIWGFSELPGETGPVGQEACIQIGTPEQPRIMFLGRDNFYLFDGARPYPIGQQIRDTFLGEVNTDAVSNTHMLLDRARQLVWIYYPSGSSETPNACVIYDYRSDRWGRADREIEYVTEFATPAVTYDDLGTLYPVSYDSLPEVPYDALFVAPGTLGVPALFDSTHTIQTLTGPPQTAMVVTGDIGDDDAYTTLRRIRMRWATKPSFARVTAYKRAAFGDSLVAGQQATMNGDSAFHIMQSARWHRLAFELQGTWESSALNVDMVRSGDR